MASRGLSRRAFIASRGSIKRTARSSHNEGHDLPEWVRLWRVLSSCAVGRQHGRAEEEFQRAVRGRPVVSRLVRRPRYFIEIQDNGAGDTATRQRSKLTVRTGQSSLALPLSCNQRRALRQSQEDAEAQDVLLCINTGKFRTDANRMKMEGDQFFLRSPEEMYAALPDQDEAVGPQPNEIADSVDIESGTWASDTSRRSSPARGKIAERLPARTMLWPA